ncbi:MAG: hypothetical protein J6T06_17255 [Victivallales bacterium]|nr:hypothetical protein [Victivallales bacterium]
MTEEHVFQGTGCESECDVVVRVKDGKIVAVEGNDCPTGASYARSQYKMKTVSKTQSTQNKI